MSLKIIDLLMQMQSRQSHLAHSLPSSFLRSSSHFASPHKLPPFSNTFATIATDPDPQEETKPQVQIPEYILGIAVKRQGERTSIENSTIMKYLLKKDIFRFLSDKLSIDVLKNIIRNGNLKVYSPGEIFLTEGKRVRNVDILLFGEACIISNFQNKTNGSGQDEARQAVKKESETYDFELGEKMDKLIKRVGREAKKYKVKQGSNKRGKDEMTGSSIMMRKQIISTIDVVNLQAWPKKQPQCFVEFDVLFDYEPKHSLTLAASQQVLVFSVPLEIFYQSLLLKYNSQLNQKLKLFRKVSVFDEFQSSKLRTLIQRLSVREFKKGEMVYRQGEQPRCFYLLIAGEVEISKTISIFNQNPNNLYKNRMRVSREQVGRQIKILPYANFNRVYNYVPEQKVITLAQVTPICIFGEEEIVDNRHRQVNARVLSLTAQCYEIKLEFIDELCSRNIGSNGQRKLTLAGFLAMMEESVTLKKILLRQNQLSDLVSYQNRCKYSTLLQGRPRRVRSLNRVNPSGASLDISLEKQPEEAPPQFNNFNFTEFMRQDVEEDTVTAAQLSEEQTRVAKLTHVKLSQTYQAKQHQKSIRLRSLSRDLSTRAKMTLDCFATDDSLTNKITLQQPLFTVNYFERQFRQQKKLYVQAKKKRLQNIYKHLPQRLARLH